MRPEGRVGAGRFEGREEERLERVPRVGAGRFEGRGGEEWPSEGCRDGVGRQDGLALSPLSPAAPAA